MKMVMQKNGISAIVATVLIILITVAAVSIIWVAVIPMITDKFEAQSFDVRTEIVTVEGYTVYNSGTGMLYVQVKQTGDASKIELIVSSGGDSVTIEEDAMGHNQKKTYTIDLSPQYFTNLESSVYVTAVPYFAKVNGDEKQGTASPKVEVKSSNVVVEEEPPVCDSAHLGLCDETDCATFGNGYWYVDTCYNALGNELVADGVFDAEDLSYNWDVSWYCGFVTRPPADTDLECTPLSSSVGEFSQDNLGITSGSRYLVSFNIASWTYTQNTPYFSVYIGGGSEVQVLYPNGMLPGDTINATVTAGSDPLKALRVRVDGSVGGARNYIYFDSVSVKQLIE